MMNRFLLFQLKRSRKYILITFAFLIWMLFFDNRNVFVQKNLNEQIEHLKVERTVYEDRLDRVKQEYEAMMNFPEKYAREKYFMHRPDEEVFIFAK